jgi:hypothetical protein
MSIKSSSPKIRIRTKLSLATRLTSSIILLLLFYSCQKDNTPDENPGSGSGTLYYVGCKGAYSFDLSTGSFNWKKMLSAGGETGTPFYDSGYIYLADPYGVCALNAANGETKWELFYSPLTGYYAGDFKGRLSPMMVDNILYTIGFEGTNFKIDLYAIDRNKGSVLWQKVLYERTENIAQPRIVGNKLIIVKFNEIVCYDRISGQLLWQTSCGSIDIDPSFYPQVDNDNIYIHDQSQNRIVAVDAAKGNITKTITLPADFDGDAFMLKGQYILGTSSPDNFPATGNAYVIDKSTGNIVSTNKVPVNSPYFFPFIDLAMHRSYSFDMATDESNIYWYNPVLAKAYDQTTTLPKWESDLPLKKITDSTGGEGVISSNQTIATDNTLIFLSSYRYIGTSTVKELYCHVDILNKSNGKLIKSLPFSNLNCTGVPYYFMVVKDGQGYYSRVDKR